MSHGMNGDSHDDGGPLPGVADAVSLIARQMADELTEQSLAGEVRQVVSRLNGPLHVAIAGRVKAGKSTLLNALVGERLAPTDAGECTKVVTTYYHGMGYEVTARLTSGQAHPLHFRRLNGTLDVELGTTSLTDIERIDVSWPSSSLQRMTLIDTPGLESINDENSRRTRMFLEPDSSGPGSADAVIYLMRHAHRADVSFLDSFMDRSVSAASPVNAIAVLSRADEIGAGRLDAIESATRIAHRYATDPQLHTLCSTVVPLSGLVAETGLTLREDEAAALRELAATDPDTLNRMLLSADQFCEVSASSLTAEWRRDLLERLGVFGLRHAIELIRIGHSSTAAGLGPALVAASGLPALQRELANRFAPRAKLLQARTALLSLRSITRRLAAVDATSAARFDRELERIEAGALDFALLRAEHLLRVEDLGLDGPSVDRLHDLVTASDARQALALDPDATSDQIRDAALGAISKWRTTSANPIADPATVEVCETAVRRAEAIYTSCTA